MSSIGREGLEQMVHQVQTALTGREQEVVRLMLAGHSSKEVARTRVISLESVTVHRKHVHSKLGSEPQQQLFALFRQARSG